MESKRRANLALLLRVCVGFSTSRAWNSAATARRRALGAWNPHLSHASVYV